MNELIKNRRDFIKEMGALAGSTAFLASIPWLDAFADQNGKNISPSDRVRIGFIGVGSRGRLLLLNVKEIENVDIVAVCDNYEPNYQDAINLTEGKANAYYNHNEMLEKEELDGVIIATPLYEHAHITVDALNAGVHVFCEKSMARTLEDCKWMVDTQKATGRILQIGHQRMFSTIYLKALERIRNGEIGKLTQIRAYWHRNNDWRRPVPSPELERKINWRLYKEYSAGLMTELASHQLQVANWFFDKVPTRVLGSGSNCYWKDREVYDQVALVYDYDEGVKCIYDSLVSNRHYGFEEQVMGDKGTFEMEINRMYSETPPKPPGIRKWIHNIEKDLFEVMPIGGASWVPETAVEYKGNLIAEKIDDDGTYQQLVGFAQAIKNGKPYKNMLREAYHSSIGVLLGLQAMDNNEIVDWPAEYVMEKEV